MSRFQDQVAIVTGASAGIGRASAVALAKEGFQLALGARNQERLADTVREIEEATGRTPLALQLDVREEGQVKAFIAAIVEKYGRIDLLLNNAGLAKGVLPVIEEEETDNWDQMIDTNVKGLLLMTREAVPHMIEGGNGHVINLGSIAGREAYAGGAVYCATKFAVRAITDALRQELLGKPVCVTTVDPGMVETGFSFVRLGDKDKADAIYQGMTPLSAADIADCIVWAATRPKHVNIDAIIVKPLDQAGAGKVARK
ncbi:MAG: SDR family NAD(P)-dependent oxidoreductase [Tumebacillaceae bacterium]